MNKAMDLFAIHRPYCFDLLIGLNFKSMQYEERLFHWGFPRTKCTSNPLPLSAK